MIPPPNDRADFAIAFTIACFGIFILCGGVAMMKYHGVF